MSIAVNSVIGVLTDRLGQGASDESQAYNSYFHDTTSYPLYASGS